MAGIYWREIEGFLAVSLSVRPPDQERPVARTLFRYADCLLAQFP